jgi:hypothetical protein
MPEASRPVSYYAAAMAVLLLIFAVGGDNGVIYAIALLGVPIGSGLLAGIGWIRFWHAAVGCLAVVVLDVVFDETRVEDAAFFAVLAVGMVGIAALTWLVTRRIASRRHKAGPATPR